MLFRSIKKENDNFIYEIIIEPKIELISPIKIGRENKNILSTLNKTLDKKATNREFSPSELSYIKTLSSSGDLNLNLDFFKYLMFVPTNLPRCKM